MEQVRAGVHWQGIVARGSRTLQVQRGALVDLRNRRGEARGKTSPEDLTRVQLSARGRVPGADGDAFAGAVRRAKEQCVVSRARSDSVVISAAAVLEPDGAVEHVDL